jgi:hypothetical protein
MAVAILAEYEAVMAYLSFLTKKMCKLLNFKILNKHFSLFFGFDLDLDLIWIWIYFK